MQSDPQSKNSEFIPLSKSRSDDDSSSDDEEERRRWLFSLSHQASPKHETNGNVINFVSESREGAALSELAAKQQDSSCVDHTEDASDSEEATPSKRVTSPLRRFSPPPLVSSSPGPRLTQSVERVKPSEDITTMSTNGSNAASSTPGKVAAPPAPPRRNKRKVSVSPPRERPIVNGAPSRATLPPPSSSARRTSPQVPQNEVKSMVSTNGKLAPNKAQLSLYGGTLRQETTSQSSGKFSQDEELVAPRFASRAQHSTTAPHSTNSAPTIYSTPPISNNSFSAPLESTTKPSRFSSIPPPTNGKPAHLVPPRDRAISDRPRSRTPPPPSSMSSRFGESAPVRIVHRDPSHNKRKRSNSPALNDRHVKRAAPSYPYTDASQRQLDDIRRRLNPKFVRLSKDTVKFFIVRGPFEEDFFSSIKYGFWASTPRGNRIIAQLVDSGIQEIYFIFHKNGASYFSGVARVETKFEVMLDEKLEIWRTPNWKGVIPVQWIYVKDLPTSLLAKLQVNGRSIAHFRDMTELNFGAGTIVLEKFGMERFPSSILDRWRELNERVPPSQIISLFDYSQVNL